MQWTARITRAHIAIVVTGILAFVLCFSYLSSLEKTIQVAKLTKNISAGKLISGKDVAFISVPEISIISSALVTKNALSKKQLLAKIDLFKSDILSKTNTTYTGLPEKYQSLSIGVQVHRANGGEISKGDSIDVWETGESARLITSNITVRNVLQPNKRLGSSTTQLLTIVVAVTAEQARALSRIVGEDNIMIVLSNGIKSEDELNAFTDENEPFVATELQADED